MRTTLALSLLGLIGSTTSALALNQNEHAAISERACEANGFEHDFCERVADEAYNTDFHEFLDLAAHAQPDAGDTACVAAGNSMKRLLDRGREIRAALRQVNAAPANHDLSAAVAKAMGRALHTIEDNCAHSGMTNPQHAWHSLSDACQGTHDSPDVQVESAQCAAREASSAFAALRQATSQLGVNISVMVPYETLRRFPPRGEVCAFLREAPEWDGVDRRWNNAIVVPAFRTQFASALMNDTAPLGNICAGGQTLAPPTPDATEDTSAGQSSCLKIQAYCVGKGDDAGEEAPPWDDEGEQVVEGEIAGGCRAGTGTGPGSLALLFGALVIGLRRRRASRLALVVASAALLFAGCTMGEEMENEDVEVLGKGDGASSGYLGNYEVTTPIRFTDIRGVPALGSALVHLRGARQNPAEAVLRAIESQDFGLLSTAIRSMPMSLRTSLVNRLNPALTPVKDQIADLAAQLEQLVVGFEVHSNILISERGRILGITKERHSLESVVFNLNGRSYAVDISNVFEDGHGSITSHGAANLDDVDLELPLGPLLLDVAGPYIFPRFGTTDLTSTLNKLIDCNVLGAEVERVISFVDGPARCRAALASITEQVNTKLVMEIEVRDGAGTIQSGTLSDGSWTWTLKLGGVELELPLTFEARRR